MSFKDMIPWRRGRQEVPVQRMDEGRSGAVDTYGDIGLAPLLRQTEDLFDRLFQGFGGSLFPHGGFGSFPHGGFLSERDSVPSLQLDMSETENAFHVSAELPGVDEKDIDVSISAGALTIRGEKRSERKEEQGDVYRMERSYGKFERTLLLPGEVDEDRIEASFRRGVLDITLPKSEAAREQVKRVPVRFSEK